MTTNARSTCALLALLLAAVATPALAQEQEGLLGRIFGRSPAPQEAPVVLAQASPSDLVLRLDRLENQIRQLTGTIEQLQFRNQQLEQQLRRMQDDVDYRFQDQGKSASRTAPGRGQQTPPPAVGVPPGPVAAPSAPAPAQREPQRRSDVFDPSENPNAPGAPRVLGAPGNPRLTPGEMRVYSTPPIEEEDADYIEPPVGIPGGRAAGAPLDLSTLSEPGAPDPRGLPPDGSGPPPSVGMGGGYPPISRNPAAPAQTAVLAPSATPRDEYDLAYGYMLRKDYALAEESFRSFLQKYPNDQRAAEAGYWLGESLFQRQRYRDAAENFLTVSTKFDKSAKAPEAMVRLAQSLAALKEKEAACATFGEVGRKFPRATAGVKQAVEREQKRVRC